MLTTLEKFVVLQSVSQKLVVTEKIWRGQRQRNERSYGNSLNELVISGEKAED